jgi:hypothetical protein
VNSAAVQRRGAGRRMFNMGVVQARAQSSAFPCTAAAALPPFGLRGCQVHTHSPAPSPMTSGVIRRFTVCASGKT